MSADIIQASEWQEALANKAALDRSERALGNPHPTFLYTDGLPPPSCRTPDCEICAEQKRAADIGRQIIFECNLRYAVEKLAGAMENIADAAKVAKTRQQFELSLLSIQIDNIAIKLRAEAGAYTMKGSLL